MSSGIAPEGLWVFPILRRADEIRESVPFWAEILQKPYFAILVQGKIIIQSDILETELNFKWWGNKLIGNYHSSSFYNKTFSENKILIGCAHTTLICKGSLEFLNRLHFDTTALSRMGGSVKKESNIFYIIFNQNSHTQNSEPETLLLQLQNNEIESWLNLSPKTNRFVNTRLWDYLWIQYRLHQIPACSPFKSPLILPIRPQSLDRIELVSPASLMIIEDLMWYRVDSAWAQIDNFFHLQRESDGMMAHDAFSSSANPQFQVNMNYTISQPPIWSYLLLETAKFSHQMEEVAQYYDRCKRNLHWWETHRYFPDFGLFGSKLTAEQHGLETNMLGSPRFNRQFNGQKWIKCSDSASRELLLVDLNSQMADYYQNMGVIGNLLEDTNASEYFQMAEQLQDNVQKYLWDPHSKFFYDLDVTMHVRQPLKTIAGFWVLFGGLASKAQIDPLMYYLTNPKEFWTELPVPSISISESIYSKELWHGSVSLSQVYWLIIGLKRYNLNNHVTRLTERILQYCNAFFDLYEAMYEYYPPQSYNVHSLTYQGKRNINRPHALGQTPLHSLFYRGILGAEILDENINFVPDWSVIPKEVNFSFYYQAKKIESFMSRMKNKMLEF